ncbi:glycosyltransferase family 8 protein [Coprinellus micaceus]|uniref:Glycosyltransferase family 8 protein n=1 Tax=Coprinellus micaceus TaxID=71717 RepID=A0A4Y7SHR3_COPMI|nr:glycosyltransferase family 8 protein [Coprinellus micaceus]
MATAPPDERNEDYTFDPSQDWFSHNISHWKSLFSHISTESYAVNRNGARILEIGSWEGRSAVFLSNELLKVPSSLDNRRPGEIVCVDHFDLFGTDAGKERFERLQHNLTLTRKKFRIIPQFSFPALTQLLNEAVVAGRLPEPQKEEGFDWVYVDGSHRSDDTFLDGEMAWRLTRKGGLMIFDDYLWDVEPDTSIHHPRRGIDAFLALHHGEYERLSAKSGAEGEGREYQVVLKKTAEMRIGYLLPTDVASTPLSTTAFNHKAFDYGINVGLTADSAYAMPLAVLLSSLVNHTPGRISIYLLDCGLTDPDKESLNRIVSGHPNVTLSILPLPDGSLTVELGSAVWAKIDLAATAPVERLLYLDTDILIRGDLRPLWDTALEGNPIGAALDIGHPLGHAGLHSDADGPKYFNAGVLLADLAKIRDRDGVESLRSLCREKKDSTYADQDALNARFSGNWKEISLKWNAQGLGTYAHSDGPGRHWVDRSAIKDPNIVHFTGPVHPPMDVVLNRWVQPYTAKPWGYAGAPGQPFAQEWFDVLETTAYQEYFEGEWKEICKAEKLRQIEEAKASFDIALEKAFSSV